MIEAATQKTTELEEQYQLATYKKMPIVAERGEGVWVFTSDGERYLDLYAKMIAAREQACMKVEGLR